MIALQAGTAAVASKKQPHFFLKVFLVARAFENPIYWNADSEDFKVFCASLIHPKPKITLSKQAIIFAFRDHREHVSTPVYPLYWKVFSWEAPPRSKIPKDKIPLQKPDRNPSAYSFECARNYFGVISTVWQYLHRLPCFPALGTICLFLALGGGCTFSSKSLSVYCILSQLLQLKRSN